jgi:hypothetical protein
MRTVTTILTVLMLASWAGAQSARETDPLKLAVREIASEAQQSIRTGAPFPRDASTFFADPLKREGIEVDRVISLLIQGTGRPPRVEAYVRWQLLSALPERLDERQRTRLAEAAVRAPAPIDMPGTSADERRALDRMAQRSREGEIPGLNAQWTQRLEEARLQNEVILAYRDALVSRVTDTDFALKVRLDDLWTRASAGLDVKKDADTWADEVRTWAVLAAPEQVRELSALVKEYEARPAGLAYTTAAWTAGRGQWRSRKTGLDANLLAELRVDLDRLGQNSAPAR